MNKLSTHTPTTPIKKSRKKLVAILLTGVVVLAGGITAGTYYVNSAAQQARTEAYDVAVLEHNEAGAEWVELTRELPESTFNLVDAWLTHSGDEASVLKNLNTIAGAPKALISEETNAVSKELVEAVTAISEHDSFPSEDQITVHAGIAQYIASQETAEESTDTDTDTDADTAESTDAEPVSVSDAVIETAAVIDVPVLPLSSDLEQAVTHEDVSHAETARDEVLAQLDEINAAHDGVTTQQDALEEFIVAIVPELIPVAGEALSNKDAWFKSHDKVEDDPKGSFGAAATKLQDSVNAITGAGETAKADADAEAENTEVPEVAVTNEESLEFVATFAAYVKSANAVKTSHDAEIKRIAEEKAAKEAEEAAAAAAVQAAQNWVPAPSYQAPSYQAPAPAPSGGGGCPGSSNGCGWFEVPPQPGSSNDGSDCKSWVDEQGITRNTCFG